MSIARLDTILTKLNESEDFEDGWDMCYALWGDITVNEYERLVDQLSKDGYAKRPDLLSSSLKITHKGIIFIEDGGYIGELKRSTEAKKKQDQLFELDVKAKTTQIFNNRLVAWTAIVAGILSLWNLANSIFHILK